MFYAFGFIMTSTVAIAAIRVACLRSDSSLLVYFFGQTQKVHNEKACNLYTIHDMHKLESTSLVGLIVKGVLDHAIHHNQNNKRYI